MKLFYLMLVMLIATPSYSAEVKKRLKKKRLVISEGKKTGFKKGTKVCIYDNDDNKITCAKIFKAKNKKSYVRIKKKKLFKKIKKGMTVKIEGSEEATAQASTQKTETAAETSTGLKGATNIKLGYVLTPLTPTIYNVASYEDPEGSDVNTLWGADQVSSLSIGGFGAEFGFGLFSSKAVIGVRSRTYKGFTIKANYTSDPTNYAETTLEASAFGFYLDYNYLIMEFGSMTLDFGNGIDIDTSELLMTTYHKNDDDTINTEIYNVSSVAQTVSLRTNLNINFFFDPIGIQVGTSLLIPLSSSASDSITANDIHSDNLPNTTVEEDVRQALGHDKGSVGFEMAFSAYFAF